MKGLLAVLRGIVSFLSVLGGIALFLFSVAVAYGWDRGPLSVVGTIAAALGLSLIFLGYWLVRNTDGAPIPAICFKAALGFGSTFLVFGLLALFLLREDRSTPTGYLVAVGSLCGLGFVKFRFYTRDH